jgi:hypothetical protein
MFDAGYGLEIVLNLKSNISNLNKYVTRSEPRLCF